MRLNLWTLFFKSKLNFTLEIYFGFLLHKLLGYIRLLKLEYNFFIRLLGLIYT